MKWKRIAVAVIAGLVTAPISFGQGAADGTSCRAFVQGFYEWYVPLALRDDATPSWDFGISGRPADFSNELRTAIQKDTEGQRKSKEIVGLDFDPFLNSQDPSPHFVVDHVEFVHGRCRAVVFGIQDGQRAEEVMPELEMQRGSWKFINFRYHDQKLGDYDLLNILRQNAHDRLRHPR